MCGQPRHCRPSRPAMLTPFVLMGLWQRHHCTLPADDCPRLALLLLLLLCRRSAGRRRRHARRRHGRRQPDVCWARNHPTRRWPCSRSNQGVHFVKGLVHSWAAHDTCLPTQALKRQAATWVRMLTGRSCEHAGRRHGRRRKECRTTRSRSAWRRYRRRWQWRLPCCCCCRRRSRRRWQRRFPRRWPWRWWQRGHPRRRARGRRQRGSARGRPGGRRQRASARRRPRGRRQRRRGSCTRAASARMSTRRKSGVGSA